MTLTWQRKERATAKKYGGRRTPNSGAKWAFKGDVITDMFLIDDKTTDHKSFSIPKKMWNKICLEALQMGRRPALKVSFNDDGTSFVCLNEPDFADLLEIAQKK